MVHYNFLELYFFSLSDDLNQATIIKILIKKRKDIPNNRAYSIILINISE